MSKIYDPETMAGEHFYSFSEVCARQTLEEDFIISCIDYGIVEVSGGKGKQDWQFALTSIPRLEKAYRLHRDLELDYSGLAIVLELLDEVDQLRAFNEHLSKRLASWEAGKE